MPSATIVLRVKPGSKTSGVSIEDGAFVLRVRARAVEGAANEACVRALAEIFSVPSRRIGLASGARSRIKRFRIDGIEQSAAERLMHEAASP